MINFIRFDFENALLPEQVRYDKDLTPGAKVLFAEIFTISKISGVGSCDCTNGYFSEKFGTSTKTIKTWVSDLVEAGYLKREVLRDENNQVYERVLTPTIGGSENAR